MKTLRETITTVTFSAQDALHEQTAAADTAQLYLWRQYGIDAVRARRLGLGLTLKGVDAPVLGAGWSIGDRIVVPMLDAAGEVRGLYGRIIDGDGVKWATPDESLGKWARSGHLSAGGATDYIVVTESVSDALVAIGAGHQAVVLRGIPTGGADDVLDSLASVYADKTYVIAAEPNPAGDDFREAAGRELSRRGLSVKHLHLDPEVNDLAGWRSWNPSGFADELLAEIRSLGSPTSAQPSASDNVWDHYSEPLSAQTQVVLAELVVWYAEQTGRRLAYVPGFGVCLYDDDIWHLTTDDVPVRRLINQASRAARQYSGSNRRDAIVSIGVKLSSTYLIDSVIKELRSIVPQYSADSFDAIPHLLAVANGVIDLRDGSVVESSAEHLISQRLTVAYNPAAQAPRWERFVSEVMSDDPEMAAFMQRLVGYGITGDTREQCMVFAYGTGSNGKSVFLEALKSVFRQVSKTVPFSAFEHGSGGAANSELASTRGARIVMSSEAESDAVLKESLIKSITGGDTISARHLYKSAFEMQPRYLIFVATNHKPQIRSVDTGIWRRVKLVNFDKYFSPESRDPLLSRKLAEEAEGILAWAVRGAVEWYKTGLREPDKVVEAVKDYKDISDILDGFYPGVLVSCPESRVAGQRVYEAFRDWCEKTGNADKRYTSRWLYARLEERGIKFKKTNVGKTFFGVRLATFEELRADEASDLREIPF